MSGPQVSTRYGVKHFVANVSEGSFKGARIGTVELSVDVDALMLLVGGKALRNKSRRSRLTGVRAVAHSVHEVTP